MTNRYVCMALLVCSAVAASSKAQNGQATESDGLEDKTKAAVQKGYPQLGDLAAGRLIFLGAKENDCSVISFGLAFKADINLNGADGTPLYIAATLGHLDALKYLLEKGADPDKLVEISGRKGNFTALMDVVKAKLPVIAEYLLDHGAHVHIRNAQGQTALHLAIENSDFEMVDLLLRKGADVNVTPDKDYVTNPPLSMAVATKNHALVRRLLTEKPNLEIPTSVHSGRAKAKGVALHIAIKALDVDMVRELLQAGADPNAVLQHFSYYYNDLSTLQYACEAGASLEIIELLILAGAESKDFQHGFIDAALLRIAERQIKSELADCLDEFMCKDLRNMVLDDKPEVKLSEDVDM